MNFSLDATIGWLPALDKSKIESLLWPKAIWDSMSYDIESQIAFGHKRLSILDLSSAGNQPMVASNEKFIIVFNGEIYNHLDLRKEIKDYANSKNIKLLWNGSSDTYQTSISY